ncbi:MAG: hypothetical protein RLY86_2467 [Pseudomonadota bacterium]|jgi:hypothetical protein
MNASTDAAGMDARPPSRFDRVEMDRPRLKPGVPAGGILAIALCGVMVVAGLVSSGGDRSASVSVSFMDPPAPPAPPHAPEAPGHGFHVEVDAEAIRREVMAAVEEARAEVEAHRAEIEAAQRMAESARDAAEARVAAADTLDAWFTATAGVELTQIQGELIVRGGEAGKVRVLVDEGAAGLRPVLEDGVLRIRGDHGGTMPTIVLEMPDTVPLTLRGFQGDVRLDDGWDGMLEAEMQQGDLIAARLEGGTIRHFGSGDISIGRVAEQLNLSILGNVDARIGEARALSLDLPGTTDVTVGKVRDLAVNAPGSTDVRVGVMDGPVRVTFPGTGTVTIGTGRSEDVTVALTGDGELVFNATAVNPRIQAGGASTVVMPNIEGEARVTKTGAATVVTNP